MIAVTSGHRFLSRPTVYVLCDIFIPPVSPCLCRIAAMSTVVVGIAFFTVLRLVIQILPSVMHILLMDTPGILQMSPQRIRRSQLCNLVMSFTASENVLIYILMQLLTRLHLFLVFASPQNVTHLPVHLTHQQIALVGRNTTIAMRTARLVGMTEHILLFKRFVKQVLVLLRSPISSEFEVGL